MTWPGVSDASDAELDGRRAIATLREPMSPRLDSLALLLLLPR